MDEDLDLQDVVVDGPIATMNKNNKGEVTTPKSRKEYNEEDKKSVEKNVKAKKILICRIGPGRVQPNLSIYECNVDLGCVAYSRFILITIELSSLEKLIPTNKLVNKILSIQPPSQESKVNAISKARDLQRFSIGDFIEKLKTYELKKYHDHELAEP